MDNKNINIRILNCLLVWSVGPLGIHKFLERKYAIGLAYLFTGGLFGFGYLCDAILSIINIFSPMHYFDTLEDDKHCENNEVVQSEEINVIKPQVERDIDYVPETALNINLNPYNGVSDSYVVIDTETTGLEANTCRIIEIAAIKYKNGQRIGEFNTLINPGQILKDEIIELTGINDKDLMGAPSIEEVLPSFFNYLEDLPLVAHNVKFDMRMLKAECVRTNIPMCENPTIDTLKLSRRLWDLDNYKLITIKEHLNMQIASHRALADCEVANRIYQIYKDNK